MCSTAFLIVAAIAICIASFPTTLAHRYTTKQCPTPTAVENFDQNRILGSWKVRYAVRTTSTCMEFEFRKDGGQFEVFETKEPAPPEKIGIQMKYGSVGTLASTAKSGHYQVSYSTSQISGRFVIMDTDYETFLLVFHCQQLSVFGSRRTLYLLSRGDNPISEEKLEQVRSRMPEVDLDPGQLAEVSHEGCVSRENADIDLTGDVSLKDVLSAAKKVVSVGGSIAQLVEVLSMLGK